MSPYRVRVLSSYVYDGESGGPHASMGRRNRWFHGFVAALLAEGARLADFDVRFERLPHDEEGVRGVARRLAAEEAQLVICPGTDAVLRWTRAERERPTLYFGAHPENHGLEILAQGNLGGVRLNLPLVWRFETFRLLRALLPDLERVHVPLNLRSEFAFPGVRANYELARRRNGASWIPGESSHVGYRSVHFLAERLGCRYAEWPYDGLDELERGVRQVEGGVRSALVGFNDTTLVEGAVERLLELCRERALPLMWVNNFPIVQAGGVADFSSDFERVGRAIGRLSLRVLRDGARPDALPFEDDPGERLGLNAKRCRELGLTPAPETRRRFHVVVD